MRAHIIEPEMPEWAEVLASAPHDVYHLPGYVATAARADGGRPVGLLVEDGSTRRLLLPLVVRPIEAGGLDAMSPYGYSGPIVAGRPGASFVEDAMGAVVRILADHGVVSLFVRLHPILELPGLDRVGDVVEHGDSVVIDLTRSEDELWHGTRANHRRDINRSLRAGHRFAFETSDASHAEFRRLYRETMTRRSAATYYLFDDAYFDALPKALGRHLHLACVRIEGRLAAAAWFTEVSGIVQLHLAGWDEKVAHHRPSKLLYHGARLWGHERGDRWMNLGGGRGSEQDSLLHFKLGFSSETRTFRTLRVVVDDLGYRRLLARTGNGSRGDVRGFFPAYRLDPAAKGMMR